MTISAPVTRRARLRARLAGRLLDRSPDSTTADTPRAARGMRQAVVALRHRNFALFWTGALISNAGTWMQNATVPYVIYQVTHSASWVGVAAFGQLFPVMLMGPFGGSIADRFTRRSVLLLTQSAQLVLALGMWVLWISGTARPASLVGLVAVQGLVAGLSIPSWQAFVSELVPRKDLLNAVTLNSAQFNGARAIGPMAAGAILATRFGADLAFLINAASYLAVIGALALIRVPELERVRLEGRVFAQFTHGLRYTRRHTGIVLALALVVAVAFLGNPVIQLAPIFADEVFHVGPALYGLMTGALGFGAVFGAAVVGWAGATIRRSQLVRVAIIGYGASLVAFAMSPVFAVGVLMLFLAGIAYLAVVSALNTSVQLLVAEEVRGRVLAIYVMCFTGAFPLGALLQGWIADRVGAPATVTMGGGLLLVVGLVLILHPGRLSTLDRHAHREPAPPTTPARDRDPAPQPA